MTDFDEADIRAFRREGSLRDFLRLQQAAGKTRRTERPAKPPRPPGHRPGAWPTGSSPPTSQPRGTPAQWAEALDDFRSGRKSDHDPCECGACPPPNKTREENR